MTAAGSASAAPCFMSSRRDVLHAGKTHVEHGGVTGLRQGRPIGFASVRVAVSGDECNAVREVAMRQRNAGVGGAPMAAVTPGMTEKLICACSALRVPRRHGRK